MYDPTLPQAGTEIDAVQMRSQLTGLKALIDAIVTLTAAEIDNVSTGGPGDPATVGVSVIGNTLHFTFSIPRGDMGSPGSSGINGNDGAPGLPGPPGEVTASDLGIAISAALADTSHNCFSVNPLSMTVDNIYQQGQMQEVANKLDELINALKRNP